MSRASRRERKKPAYNPNNTSLRNQKSGQRISMQGYEDKRKQVEVLKEKFREQREIQDAVASVSRYI